MLTHMCFTDYKQIDQLLNRCVKHIYISLFHLNEEFRTVVTNYTKSVVSVLNTIDKYKTLRSTYDYMERVDCYEQYQVSEGDYEEEYWDS